jgi:type I restriction enzyme R subunit
VQALNLATGELETAELDDELHFQVESFNKRVINEDFNRVICNQLAQELDPMGEEKTLIFCATDAHADMVKRLLDEALPSSTATSTTRPRCARSPARPTRWTR